MTSKFRPAAVALLMLLAACGGGDTATVASDEPSTVEATTEATEAPTSAEPTEESVKDVPTAPAAPEAPPAAPPAPPVAPAAPPAPNQTLQPLEPDSGSGADSMSDIGNQMGTGGETSYAEYVTITDDTGAIAVEVPTEWSDVDGRPYNDEQGRQLFDVRAAASLQTFAETWDVPGIIVTASREVAQTENEVTLLDELNGPLSEQCTYLGRQPYSDPLYAGQVDVYDECGGTQTGYVVLGAVPSSRAFVIRVQVQVVEERDLEALIRALDSFVIVGDV